MKKTLLTLLIGILLFGWGACNEQKKTEDMTTEEILQVLDIKISKNKKDDKLYYDRAKILLELHRNNEAISDLTNAINLDDANVAYYLLLADAHFSNGSVDQSYKALQKALDLDDKNKETHLKMGEIAFYSRDYDRALESLTKVTEQEPNNRTALFMKGFVYKETGDTVKAITLLQKVCDLYPDYGPAFEELGILYATHHSKLAVEYLSTAINLEPTNVNARYGLAMFYQDLHQEEQAEALYKEILEIEPKHKESWHNRGYIQLFTYGDYELAIDYFSRAIQCDNTFIEALTNRGCAYELSGNPAEAESDFRSALLLNANYQPALDGLKRLGKKN